MITGAEPGALTSHLTAILVMYGSMGNSSSYSYRECSKGPESLIYKTRPSLFNSVALCIPSTTHGRSHRDDRSPLLPTALQEVLSFDRS